MFFFLMECLRVKKISSVSYDVCICSCGRVRYYIAVLIVAAVLCRHCTRKKAVCSHNSIPVLTLFYQYYDYNFIFNILCQNIFQK